MDYKLAQRRGRKPMQGNDRPSDFTMNPTRYAICKGCRRRIMDDRPRVWSSNPRRPGLHHDSPACLAA